jgi:hypothetical protein
MEAVVANNLHRILLIAIRAVEFERYLKSASGRAFVKRRR